MPNPTTLPIRRHERGGSTTMTVDQAAEAGASAAAASAASLGPYPTLLLKGSSSPVASRPGSMQDVVMQKEVEKEKTSERERGEEREEEQANEKEKEKVKEKEKETSASPETREGRRSALEKLLEAVVVDDQEQEHEDEREERVKGEAEPWTSPSHASTSASASEPPQSGPSRSYAGEVHDIYLPWLDKTRPHPAELPPTPREGELFLRTRFPLEEPTLSLSPRAGGKQAARPPPSITTSELHSSPPTQSPSTSQAQHDQRLLGLAEACASAAASQQQQEFAELIGEVAKILRKMYHLAWERDDPVGGIGADGAPPPAQAAGSGSGSATPATPAAGTGTVRPKATPSAIQKVQDICQISQASESQSEHPHASDSSPPEQSLSLPDDSAESGESKVAAIQQWLEQVQTEGGSSALPPPAWASKLGLAPSSQQQQDGENGYEQTLVGDALDAYELLPTKLPADDNPEDLVDRVSLTAELPIRAWIRELTRRTDVSASQVKVAACYMIALRPHIAAALRQRQEAAHAITTNQPLLHYRASPLTCPRRTLIGALVLASKFLGEKTYSLSAWARVTGLEAPDLVESEHTIGSALRWDLWVGANIQSLRSDVFTRTLLQLVSAPGPGHMVRPYPAELLAPQLAMPAAPSPGQAKERLRERERERERTAPHTQGGEPMFLSRDVSWPADPAARKRRAAELQTPESAMRAQKRRAAEAEPLESVDRAQKRRAAAERPADRPANGNKSNVGPAPWGVVLVKREPVEEPLFAEAY